MKEYLNFRQYSKVELSLFALFIISILAFIVYKISYLHLAYFWDESWVYGPALSEMSSRFPSLLPGSIDIDLSRGHPMLFHFFGGLWGNIFGNSTISLHTFALFISIILIFQVWKYSKTLTNIKIASIVVMLLLSQAIFLAQSAMVLPEVLVSLFALISIFHWSKEKYLSSVFFASLCLLSKESGAMLMPSLGLSWLFHSLLTKTFSWKKAFHILTLLVLACLPYILFLIVQKIRFGWMLYPNHLDLQVSEPWVLQRQLKYSIYYLAIKDGRIFLTVLSILSLMWQFRPSRLFWASSMYLAINIMFIFAWDWNQWITVSIYLSFMFISLATLILQFKNVYRPKYFYYLISILFLIIFLLFTAFNFYSSRYILICVVIYLILCGKALSYWKLKFSSLLALISLCFVFLYFALKRTEASDVNQSFIDYGTAQLALTSFMENEKLYEEAIFAPFLIKEGLEKRYAGFRSNDSVFSDIKYGFNDHKVMYTILSSRSDEKVSQRNLDDRKLEYSKKFESGNAWFILEKYAPK